MNLKQRNPIFIGTCEHCGNKHVKVQRVKVYGTFNIDRGYADLCLDCHSMEVEFQSRGQTFFTTIKGKKP